MFRSSHSLRTSTSSLLRSSRKFSTSGPVAKVYHQADNAAFKDRVLNSSNPDSTKIVLTKFTASWCPPCKVLKPILEKMQSEKGAQLTGKQIDLMEVDVDEQQELAAEYKVRAMPTVIAFKDGKPIKSFMGALPESQVVDFIKSL